MHKKVKKIIFSTIIGIISPAACFVQYVMAEEGYQDYETTINTNDDLNSLSESPPDSYVNSENLMSAFDSTDNNLIYNFKDPKKEGTVTFVKKWKDNKDDSERPVPDIEISTSKPNQNINGYTVTFHGNGLAFADGNTENKMLLNSSKDIISGQYKIPVASYVFWYTEPSCINKVKVDSNGVPQMDITGDIELYAKAVTFTLKTGVQIKEAIPDDVTAVIFTNNEMPENATSIEVDDDGDGGVVAWVEDNHMYISTQIEGIEIKFNSNSSSMFSSKQNLNSILFHNIDTSGVTNMASMFYYCTGLSTLDLSNFNTSKATSMPSMFYHCNKLTSLDLSSFDTSNVIYAYSMFKECNIIPYIDVSNFNTSKINNMNDMFNGCSLLESVDVSGFNTENVTGMGYMFYGCRSLKTLDVSGFSTSRVTTFVGMFSGCKGISELNVYNFNTSRTTNLSEMFYGCSSLMELNVSNFDTSKSKQLNHMFGGCGKLKKLDVSGFDTSLATSMQYMFTGMASLTELDVSNFDTSNVTNMEQMFYNCNKLTSLSLSKFNTAQVKNICNMFNFCRSLTTLDISSFDSSNMTNMNWTFSNLSGLKTLKLGENFAFVGTAYGLTGTWMNSEGEEFDAKNIPGNVTDIYTKR